MHALALQGSLPVWDRERREADVSALVRWVGQELEHPGPLEDLHTRLSPDDAFRAASRLTQRSEELAPHLDAVLRTLLPELDTFYVQRFAHFRVLLPGDPSVVVPAHTDYGFGHDLSERNLWIPLTNALGSSGLSVASFAASMAWIGELGRAHGELPAPPDMKRWELRRGEVLLFSPLHVHHGNVPTKETRVSIDLRIVPTPPRLDATFRKVRS